MDVLLEGTSGGFHGLITVRSKHTSLKSSEMVNISQDTILHLTKDQGLAKVTKLVRVLESQPAIEIPDGQ